MNWLSAARIGSGDREKRTLEQEERQQFERARETYFRLREKYENANE